MKKGSIIHRPLDGALGFVYEHAGIYIGKKKVIHFAGEAFGDSDAMIEEITLHKFSKGHDVRIVKEPHDRVHGRNVCAKAEEILQSHNTYNKSYCFVSRNCESFVKECFELIDGKGELVKAPKSQVDQTTSLHSGIEVAAKFVEAYSLLKNLAEDFSAQHLIASEDKSLNKILEVFE